MKQLIVKEIPVDLTAHHPQVPNDVLPHHEFSMGLIGKFIFFTKPLKAREKQPYLLTS